MLLCDFHIHTTWSNGTVPLHDVVDIYGQAGFDVIAVTDHVYNSDSTIGTWAERLNKTITGENFDRYLEALASEAGRALAKYGMLVIPGVEITKNYFSEQESAHVLLLDIKRFVSADLPWEEVFREGKGQDAEVVA
ncbi:MAG: PHP domain-containing protein [Candidatus Deferrimicrobiota bacterium]